MLHCEIRGGRRVFVGDHCMFNHGVLLAGQGGRLAIGENVDAVQEANIWIIEHDVHGDEHVAGGADVTIGDHVWIGAGSNILPSVTIAQGDGVAAGAVLTKPAIPMSLQIVQAFRGFLTLSAGLLGSQKMRLLVRRALRRISDAPTAPRRSRSCSRGLRQKVSSCPRLRRECYRKGTIECSVVRNLCPNS